MCGPPRFFHGFQNKCGCHDLSPRIEGFIVPCLLLILKEQSIHGYELIEKLETLPFLDVVPDPGVVYRHLRRLEEEGMVESRLEPGSGGPARKVYSLTPEGEGFLKVWESAIRKRKTSLEGFLAAFEKAFPSDGKDKQ
ncbi:MAG: PadR family transcriptional regulator [Firmicutes bacterium]|nr:PadR family transcriptional regulator [Bacillota bacterium]